MSNDRHEDIPDDSTFYERHNFEEKEESVVVPPKGHSGGDDDNLWPAERRLYQIFPSELNYSGSTRRSKKSCGGGNRMM